MHISYYEVFTDLYARHRAAVLICAAVYFALLVVSYWVLFRKAKVTPWHAMIPILNDYRMFQLAWGDGYFFLFQLIPFLGFVFRWIMLYKLCQAFGKGEAKWIACMLICPLLTRLVLAFGSAAYIGPEGRPPEDNPYRFL